MNYLITEVIEKGMDYHEQEVGIFTSKNKLDAFWAKHIAPLTDRKFRCYDENMFFTHPINPKSL